MCDCFFCAVVFLFVDVFVSFVWLCCVVNIVDCISCECFYFIESEIR